MSHLGRPDGKPNPSMTLKPVAERLGELLKKPVTFLPECVAAGRKGTTAWAAGPAPRSPASRGSHGPGRRPAHGSAPAMCAVRRGQGDGGGVRQPGGWLGAIGPAYPLHDRA